MYTIVNHEYYCDHIDTDTADYFIKEICADEGITPSTPYAVSATYLTLSNCVRFNSEASLNCYTVEQICRMLFSSPLRDGYMFVSTPIDVFYKMYTPMLDHVTDVLWRKYGYGFHYKEEIRSFVDQAVCELYAKGCYLWKGLIETHAKILICRELKKIKRRREALSHFEVEYDENDYDDGETDEELFREVADAIESEGGSVTVVMTKICDKSIDKKTSDIIRKTREHLGSTYVPRPNSRGKKRKAE